MNTLLKRTIWLFALLVGVANFLIIISDTSTTGGKITLICEIGVVAVAFACAYWQMVKRHSLWREAFTGHVPSKYDAISERKKRWILLAITTGGAVLMLLLDIRTIYLAAAFCGLSLLSVVLSMVNRRGQS